MISNLKQLFVDRGTGIDIPMGHRIFLHHMDSIFWLETGDLDFFILVTQEIFKPINEAFSGDVFPGQLFFLTNVKAGQVIFPFPLDTINYRVIGLANSAIKLRAVPRSDIQAEMLGSKDIQKEMLEQIDRWVKRLSTIFEKYRIHHVTHYLIPGLPVTLHAGETVSLPRIQRMEARPITWVQVTSGTLNLVDAGSISLKPEDPPFPLAYSAWWRSLQDTQARVFSEEYNQANSKYFWNGLDKFQQSIMQLMALELIQQSSKEKVSSSLKDEREKELLDITLRKMGAVLAPRKEMQALQSSKPLLNACQLIGTSIQQKFIEPVKSKATDIWERIYEIATSSGVYYRKVQLGNSWWKQDQGPLLGFFEDRTVKPIALLPPMPGKYEAIDPSEGTTKKVDASLARKIMHQGAVFYRSFPSKSTINNSDILSFCLKGRSRDLWTIFFVGLLGGIIALYMPFANKILFDEVVPYLDHISFIHILIGMAVLFISTAIITITREYALLRIETYLNHDVEAALWARLFSLPSRFFRKFTSGNLMQRLSSIQEIRRELSGQVIRIVINGIFSILYLIAMLYFSVILSVVGLSILLIGFIITGIGFVLSQRAEKNYQDMERRINGKMVQMIFGLSKIRTNGVENRIFTSWANDTLKAQQINLSINKTATAVHVANDIIQSLKILVIFMVIMGLMNMNTESGSMFSMSIGTFLAFNAAFISFAAATFALSNTLMEMIKIYPLWQSARVILNQPTESSNERKKPGVLSGDLRIEHLSFRYDPSNPLVLEDVSLFARPGELIGIVGPSGCGKSSLIRVLLGLENPEQGAIYYDGKDLANLDLCDVRSQMGVVLQNNAIIGGSVRENILGGSIAGEDEIMEAIRLAGFDTDVKEFPMGLNTMLTPGGASLSGGQRQRLQIARAFVTKASIMIWDEATNALDNVSQEFVEQNFEKLDATRIMVAHSLHSVQHADRIYVMDKGKIVESGTFKELSDKGGLFSQLLTKQTL